LKPIGNYFYVLYFCSRISKKYLKIADELINRVSKPVTLGLRDSGLAQIALFLFIYSRLKEDAKYEEIANRLLDKCLTIVNKNRARYDFASQLTDTGRIIDLLVNDKYFEVDSSEFDLCFEKPLMNRLRNDVGVDFGFQTGITGICDFFLNRLDEQEALEITFAYIFSGLGIEGYLKHPIESLFLFPSEILRDVKIFFNKLRKLNKSIPQKELQEQAIRKLESKRILRSNCHEYSILQDLREAGIRDDRNKIRSSMKIIASSSSNLIFRGLAFMSMEDETLSNWWKLV